MSTRQRASKVGTVGDLIRAHYQLYMSCGSCGLGSPVDLDAIVLARGESLTLQRLVELGRCTRCGRRNADITISPDMGEAGKFSYPKW